MLLSIVKQNVNLRLIFFCCNEDNFLCELNCLIFNIDTFATHKLMICKCTSSFVLSIDLDFLWQSFRQSLHSSNGSFMKPENVIFLNIRTLQSFLKQSISLKTYIKVTPHRHCIFTLVYRLNYAPSNFIYWTTNSE